MMIKTTNIEINYITTCRFIIWSYAKELFVHINMLPITKRHGE